MRLRATALVGGRRALLLALAFGLVGIGLLMRGDMTAAEQTPVSSPTAAAEQGLVNVIIFLKDQPLHAVAEEVKSEYAPLLEAEREKIRAIEATRSPTMPEGGWATREEEAAAIQEARGQSSQGAEGNGQRPAGDGGLSAEQTAQIRQASAQMEATLREMRREMLRRAEPDIEVSQAGLVGWLESAGAEVRAHLRVVNAVTAAVPSEQMKALQARPEVAEIAEDREMLGHLNVSRQAIYQPTWESAGYLGGIWDIGILDSGIDASHPGLDHLSWYANKCLTAAGNPVWDNTTDDVNGHGTSVTSIAVGDDATYRGIAPDPDVVLNLKAGYDQDGADGGPASMYWSDMMTCVDWALTTAPDDADVFNLSYGGCYVGMPDDSGVARFWDAVVSDLLTPAAMSAGNYNASYPCTRNVTDTASAYNVISVANVNDNNTTSRSDDTINPGSSWGPTPGGRKKPDLAAPGTAIMSANNSWEVAADWVEYTGTSMAAPHVAGALLLLTDYNGIENPRTQKAILINTAQDMGTSGWDTEYGWGYIDLDHAYFHRDDWFSGSIEPRPDFRLYRGPAYSGDTATLVWNRRAGYAGDSYPGTYYALSDLDLHMYNEDTNGYMDGSTSIIDNVEVVKANGTYTSVIKVDAWSTAFAGAGQEAYALATEEGFSAASLGFSLGTSNYGVNAGDEWIAVVSVQNVGNIAAHNLSLSLTLPAGLSIVSGSNPQTTAKLAAGAIWTPTWMLRADSSGAYSVPVDLSSSSYSELFSDSSSFSVSAAPSVGPLSYQEHFVDDDNSGNSSGNDNGIAEPGETIELYVSLLNSGLDTAAAVEACIGTDSPYVTWLYNICSSYGDIPSFGWNPNMDDFDFQLAPGTPSGHVINFTLDITAANGGPWVDSFEVIVGSDIDGDACTASEEGWPGVLPSNPGATCSSPAPCYADSIWYDFYDVPVPASPDPGVSGSRSGAVTLGDALATLFYVGTYDNGPANVMGVDYDSLKDGDWFDAAGQAMHPDGVLDQWDEVGRRYDRSPSAEPNPPWEAGPPNGAVTMGDVLVVLNQVGLDCGGAP